ncbi:MAG: hypothetical protein HGB08_00885 [Candidatus Moranbacteria bacterium]|nr:hypothetical protein [Candidatus Moranbacteria bacterium]
MSEYKEEGAVSSDAEKLEEKVADAWRAFQQAIVPDGSDEAMAKKQKQLFLRYQELRRQLDDKSSAIAA